MAGNNSNNLCKIAIFYDGNFFYSVSNYYAYHHPKKSRIGIKGLHQFIVDRVRKEEGSIDKHYQIVDAHYFRGRMSAQEAQDKDILYKERMFDDVLLKEGLVTHYLPLSPEGEKGIDVWFALEAFELSIYKKIDVAVLIASDGDYVPLIRKLNTIGTRVMVLGWDFDYVDINEKYRTTNTSKSLLEHATYPLLMNDIIDKNYKEKNEFVDNLFIKNIIPNINNSDINTKKVYRGKVEKLHNGFGFIASENEPNLFFHHSQVINVDFNDLLIGDVVTFKKGENQKGVCATKINKDISFNVDHTNKT